MPLVAMPARWVASAVWSVAEADVCPGNDSAGYRSRLRFCMRGVLNRARGIRVRASWDLGHRPGADLAVVLRQHLGGRAGGWRSGTPLLVIRWWSAWSLRAR